MDNSMKTMEKMMNTLGKSMNTMEKPTETMEKSMNSAAWQILAPKFNKVCRSLLQNVANWWWLVHLPWNRRPDKKIPGETCAPWPTSPIRVKALGWSFLGKKRDIFTGCAAHQISHPNVDGFFRELLQEMMFSFSPSNLEVSYKFSLKPIQFSHFINDDGKIEATAMDMSTKSFAITIFTVFLMGLVLAYTGTLSILCLFICRLNNNRTSTVNL